jgi:flagellar motility protein MotE (MotC chaperone)
MHKQSDPSLPTLSRSPSSYGNHAKVEETIKAYENRIKSLEKLLQENYHSTTKEIILQDEVSRITQLYQSEKVKAEESARRLEIVEKDNAKVTIQLT